MLPVADLEASGSPAATRRRSHKPLAELVRSVGGRFSSELGIRLDSRDSREIFKWWLAAILYGARIPAAVAARTYRQFAQEGLMSPEGIRRRGWDGLVETLDRGGYARYDFRTANKLLAVCGALIENYGGDLAELHAKAANSQDLEQRLRELGKGIGSVTVGIFLRELRGIWPKADPLPSELVLVGAKQAGLLPGNLRDKRRALAELKAKWIGQGGRESQFPDFEAALVRQGLAARRSARRNVQKD